MIVLGITIFFLKKNSIKIFIILKHCMKLNKENNSIPLKTKL